MDVEKTIEFLLENQARHDAWLQAFREETDRFREETNRRIAEHDRAIAEHDQRFNALTDLVGRVAQAGLVAAQRMDTLAERLAEQAERLDVLIVTVEKYLSRNGGHS